MDSLPVTSPPAETTPAAPALPTAETAASISARLTPNKADLNDYTFGVSLGTSKPIDLGGNKKIDDAISQGLKKKESVDFDWALWESINTVLAPIYQMKLDAGDKQDPRIALLTPAAQMALADFEDLRVRAAEIANLRDSKDKTIKPTGQERVFHSGVEVRRALLFLEQTEIIAANSLGYQLTNQGTDSLDFQLTGETIDYLQRGQSGPDNGVLAQLGGKLKAALSLDEPEAKKSAIAGVLATLTAADIGTLVGAFSVAGGPLGPGGGALVGMALSMGAGVVVTGADIMIGNWRMSLKEPIVNEQINFSLKFEPNLPSTPISPENRLTDNPIADQFKNRGMDVQEFLSHAEKTRHGIFSRLGLRVQEYTPINWNNLSRDEADLIRRLYPRNDVTDQIYRRGNVSTVLTRAERALVDYFAEVSWMGSDLGIVDLHAANLSKPGTSKADMQQQVRKEVQVILAAEYKHLPATQLSATESYRDFSGLTPAERQKITIRAYNRVAAEICSAKGQKVLERIAKGGDNEADLRAKSSDEMTRRENAIEAGTKVIHKSEGTEAQIRKAELDLAESKGDLAQIEETVNTLNHITTNIKERKNDLPELETALDQARTTQGSRSKKATAEIPATLTTPLIPAQAAVVSTGEIAKFEVARDGFIKEKEILEKELGKGLFDATTNKYPPDSLYGKQIALSETVEEKSALRSDIQDRMRLRPPTANRAEFDSANKEWAKAKAELEGVERAIAEKERKIGDLDDNKIKEQENKIIAAETIVKTAESALQAKRDQITNLEARQQIYVKELQSITGVIRDFTKEAVSNLVISTRKADFQKLEKEMREKGLVRELKEGSTTEYKPVISKEDKEVARALKELAAVCKTDEFNKIMSGILLGKEDLRKLADRQNGYNELLRVVFGEKALDSADGDIYRKILSKSRMVEAVIDYLAMDGSTNRLTNFFATDADAISTYKTTRTNSAQIETWFQQLQKVKSDKPADMDNQVRILQNRILELQTANTRALGDIYDEHIAPVIGEHRLVATDVIRIAIDRARKHALEDRIFRDNVEFIEGALPHVDADGSILVREPKTDPETGNWITGNTIQWSRADGFSSVNIVVTPTNEINATYEMRPQNLDELVGSLPADRADIIAGTPVYNLLNSRVINGRTLLDYIYDPGTGRRLEPYVLLEILSSFNPPPLLPDMTITSPQVNRINAFLRNYQLRPEALNALYPPVPGDPPPPRLVNNSEFVRIISDGLDRQTREELGLRVEINGLADADEMELWISGGSNYRTESAVPMFRNLARNLAENVTTSNAQLLGDRFAPQTRRVGGGPGWRVTNNRGELRLDAINTAGVTQDSFTLQDVLRFPNEAARLAILPNLTDARLSSVLELVGRESVEAMRNRTP